jgi:glycerol-3-phosphate acyltransferase PlsY
MRPAVTFLSALFSYLLGSIPTGYLMARARGIDIRTVGSGNVGATNVARAVGKLPGLITLIVDCAKGLVAVLAVPPLVARWFGIEPSGFTSVLCAMAAILGHNYPCWLKFRGGKGIATSAGAILGLAPVAMLICLAVWLLVFAVGRYVSLASIMAAVMLPVAIAITRGGCALLCLGLFLAVLAIWRHRSNIQRLLDGTEHRFSGKPKAKPRIT